ncbi:hypothetical protein PG991_006992 [Apiospora marii]|uniref:Uncharacterized protein n=1 Tax=Apiospora marii TaxID=335849 RepID=A0ABR1RYV9_9PEZI
MATTDSTQPLIAAFVFGILFNTASAGFILYLKGHGSAIFRDGLRLALIIFLATSGLWALVGFISTLLAPTASSQCQTAVIISTLFDQVARTAIQQFLVWAVAKDGTSSVLGKIQQFQVLARFIVGMVFVAETRPQFNSTCVPASNLAPIAIVVIALDAVMLVTLAIRALSSDNSGQDGGKRKAILLTITALAVWMGTSVTLLLGLRTIDLLLRTTVPAAGLFILVALVTVFVGILGAGREIRQQPPVSPTPQNYNRNRDLSTADTDDYPPSRYAELKGAETTITTFPNENAQVDENGLPTLTRPITGVVGIGGVPVQGQLFPPMRPQRENDAPQMPPKRLVDVKNQGSKSKKGAGKLAISNPIPAETTDMQDALNKIPTIDLATAWKNEKERRAVNTQVRNSATLARNPSTTLIASRPAPQPPQNVAKDEKEEKDDMSRFPSISGKDGYPIDRLRSTHEAEHTDEALSVGGNASSSTGVQLSPGNEEAVRRRSPRQATSSVNTPSFKPVTPGQPVRIPIPRPRPPPVEEEKSPEPVKTPLQRRPTTGLPSNPRARSTRRVSEEEKEEKEKGNERQETVMFINSIVYDDPSYVNDIIQGATKTPSGPPDSGESILERPRPIRRMSDTDRQVFPSEPMHRRSKSGGSVASRKSILQSVPGSPTDLPPLPPPPKSAGSIQRPHPNDTKSMTFDEKMTLLYPPSTTTSPAEAPSDMKRKSSVPSLPPLPMAFRKNMPSQEEETNMNAGRMVGEEKRDTTTTGDRSSIRTQSILGEEDDTNKRYTQNSARDGTKRSSSPVLPAVKFSRASGASDAKTQFSTNWGSVHSPVAPIDIQQAWVCPKETYIKTQGRPPVPSAVSGVGEEVMTVMLDTASEEEGEADNRKSFFFEDDDEKSLPDESKTEAPRQSQWHRRVGDECLSFSERKDKVRSRMMPPPPPLLLNGIGTKKAIMIPAPEPSPLESPEAAIQIIQAQLKKFEQPNRDSVESTGRRIALLENLEQEMGMQENRWHSLQNNINRDSVSTTNDTPVKESAPESITESTTSASSSTRSLVAERIADRRASRRARMASLSGSTSREQSTERPSSQNSDSRKSTAWQVRLAEAQSQYSEHANDLLQKRNNLNFLSVTQSADLGSPTPPETDESETESDSVLRNLAKQPVQPVVEVNSLWTLSPQQPEHSSNQLWMSPLPKEVKPFPELPGLTVRPALRKTSEPLMIESSSLWQKPTKTRSARTAGLWTKAVPKERPVPQKVMVRQTTQRPPRRTKRITALPDIIESPKPLPEKRGTLGIFQFPWGQKSDNATIPVLPQQPRMFMAMPGTMTSGGPRSMPGTMSSGGARPTAALEARAQEVQESEESGYSSSFFDDYEEEDSGDNLNDDDYYDSGDDFDETTLWEIASLLKTDEGLPGRDSLTLPTMGGASLDEYESEMSPAFERIYGDEYSGLDAVYDDSEPAAQAMESAPRAQDLWVPKAPAAATRELGLPQPDGNTWASYMPDESGIVRPQSRVVELAPIESDNLWGSAPVTPAKPAALKSSKAKATTWTPAAEKAVPSYGLPQPIQSVWASYLPAESEPKRNPPRFEEPAPLESDELWSSEKDMDFQMDDYLWAPVFKVRNISQSRSVSPPVAPLAPLALKAPEAPVAPLALKAPEAPVAPLALKATKTPAAQEVAAKTVNAMWTPSAASASPAYGLQQPIASVWASYIPSEEGMIRAQSRKEEIRPIQSTKLWSPKTKSVSKTMLWSKPSVQEEQTFGLAQPDTAVWASYIPSNAGMTRTQSRREEIQPIQSTSLWSLKTESAPKTMMWSKPSVQEQQTFGLSQPDAAVWQSYLPEQMETTRAQPRFEEMPTIESYNLWMPQEVEFASSTGLLWSESAESAALLSLVPTPAAAPVATPKPEARQVAAPVAAAPRQVSVSLWDQPAAVVASTESEGLFDASAPRVDYRRTSKLPAAIAMTTKPRSSHEPLPQLTSQQLWVAAPRSVEEPNETRMWAPLSGSSSLAAPASSTVASAGLFKLDSERTIYRTTDAEPAALHMTRKPRQINTAVPTIESSRMWSPTANTRVELDWITISTIRPRSPSLLSVASSNSTMSSPTTDSSSVRTTATKASTAPSVAESERSEFSLRGWFGRKNKKSESDLPKLPEQPELPKNLDEQLRLDEPLPIKNLDEEIVIKNLDEGFVVKNLDEELVVKNLDAVAPAKPVYRPTRQQYRQPVAYRGNWDAALSEAISASYPNTRFALVHASEAQWDEALQAAIKASGPTQRVKRSNSSPKQWSQALAQAIAASYPDKRFSRGQIPYSQWEDELREAIARSKRHAAFDSSKRHPVFMATTLMTDAQTVHPAAIGYTYDVASRHPVLMGSATSATSENAHPAMPRPAKKQQQQQIPQKQQTSPARPFTPPRPLSRGGKVAALAGRISFLNESSRPASVVVPPMPRASVMLKPAAAIEPAAPQPQVAPLSLSKKKMPSMLWSKPAQSAARPQGLMWTAPSVHRASSAPSSLQASTSERPQRKASLPSSSIEVGADFGAQGMWQRSAQTQSRGRNWLEGAHKHTSKVQLRY